jgi:hypothetical protein
MIYTQEAVHAYVTRRLAAVIKLDDYELVENGLKFTRYGVDVRIAVLNDDEDSVEINDLEWMAEIDGVKHFDRTLIYGVWPKVHEALQAAK